MGDFDLSTLLTFARRSPDYEASATLYKYLYDTDFTEEEVKNWGNIGTLTEVLKASGQDDPVEDIDVKKMESFINGLSVGNTPRPTIRKRMQMAPPPF